MVHCQTVSEVAVMGCCKSARDSTPRADTNRLLTVAIETLLLLADDQLPDVRMTADEALNRIVRVSEYIYSYIGYIYILHYNLQGYDALRCVQYTLSLTLLVSLPIWMMQHARTSPSFSTITPLLLSCSLQGVSPAQVAMVLVEQMKANISGPARLLRAALARFAVLAKHIRLAVNTLACSIFSLMFFEWLMV